MGGKKFRFCQDCGGDIKNKSKTTVRCRKCYFKHRASGAYINTELYTCGCGSGQTGAIVVGLTLNQVGGGQVGGVLPPGWFRRVRSVNTSGAPTYTYNSGQEVLL